MAIKTEDAFGSEELTQGVITQDAFSEKKPSTLASNLKNYGLGVSGLGIAGAGIATGVQALRKPRIAYKGIETKLGGMAQEMGLGDKPFTYIPEVLNQQMIDAKALNDKAMADINYAENLRVNRAAESNVVRKLKIDSLENTKNDVGLVTKALNDQLSTFDENVIGKTTEELGSIIKKGYSPFFSSASDNYASGIAKIEKHFETIGQPIDTASFSKGFISKTISNAKSQGVMDETLAPLIRLEQQLTPSVDKAGIMAAEQPMTFRQAKGYMSEVVNTDPNGKLGAIARDSWGDYLEEIAPGGEIKGKLGELNSQYRTFKNLKTRLMQISDPNTGGFDSAGLRKLIAEYSKTRHNDGIIDLLDYLSEGSPMASPIEGVRGKWKNLQQLLEDRFKFETNIQKQQGIGTGIEGQIAVEKTGGLRASEEALSGKASTIKARQTVEEELRARLDKINSLNKRYSDLTAELEHAGQKIPLKGIGLRNMLKTLAKTSAKKIATGGILGIGTGLLNMTPAAMQAEFGTTDIGEILKLKKPIFGEKETPLREAYQKMKYGEKLTKDEQQLLVDSGLIL